MHTGASIKDTQYIINLLDNKVESISYSQGKKAIKLDWNIKVSAVSNPVKRNTTLGNGEHFCDRVGGGEVYKTIFLTG